jgi:transcription elongation factor GreA
MGPPPDGRGSGGRPTFATGTAYVSLCHRREESEVNALPAERDRALFVTADGYEQLRTELETLSTTGRREMSERLREARQDGHLANNPALYELLEEQARLERRIIVLEAQLAATEIGVPAADGAAGVGSFVRVRDLQTGEVDEYELVGAIESNVGRGRVSTGAPVGRALVDRRAGAVVEVETPCGTLALEILSVRAPSVRVLAKKAA